MLRGLIRYTDIAEAEGLTLQSIRRLAMRPDWPPVALAIGPVKFYRQEAVRHFFVNRIDGRTREGRALRRRRRRA